MKDTPKISVIVPIYNTAKYLEQCLKSLCLQTYKNLEIICVNDGSTDNSLEILKKYSDMDKRIVIINQENQGQSAARNAGQNAATGEWVTFVDSDDWLNIEAYEEFYKAYQKDNSFEIFMFNAASYPDGATEENIVLKPFYSIENWGGKNNTIVNYDDCQNPLEGNLAVYNKIFRKDFVQKYDLKFPVGKNFEDKIYWMRAVLNAKSIYIIDRILYYYRLQASSVTHNAGRKNLNIFPTLAQIRDEMIKTKHWEESKYAMLQYKFRQYAWFFLSMPSDIRNEFYESAVNDLKQDIEANKYRKDVVDNLQDSPLLGAFLQFSADEFYDKLIDRVEA